MYPSLQYIELVSGCCGILSVVTNYIIVHSVFCIIGILGALCALLWEHEHVPQNNWCSCNKFGVLGLFFEFVQAKIHVWIKSEDQKSKLIYWLIGWNHPALQCIQLQVYVVMKKVCFIVIKTDLLFEAADYYHVRHGCKLHTTALLISCLFLTKLLSFALCYT